MPNSRDFMSEEKAFGPGSGLTPAPNAAPIIPTQPSTVAPNLQGTISPSFQHDASYVNTAQNSPTGPNFSMMPLGPQNSVSSAQIQSTIKLAPGSSSSSSSASGTVSLSIPGIFTPTAQTEDLPNADLSFELVPQLANTVFSGPVSPNANIGALDFVSGDAACNTPGSITPGGAVTLTAAGGTPAQQDLIFLLTSLIPTSGTPSGGWNATDAPLYYQISSTATSSGTNTFGNSGSIDIGAAQMIFGLSYPSSTPPPLTVLASGGGAWDSSSPLHLTPTYTSSTTAILVIQYVGERGLSAQGYSGSTVTDSAGNTYNKIGEFFNQQFDSANSRYYGGDVAAWVCTNPVAGTPSVVFVPATTSPTGGISIASAAIYDISGLGTISAIPTFKPISDFLSSIGVSSLNSLTGAVDIAAGSGVTVTVAGQNITIAASGGGFYQTVYSNGVSQPQEPGLNFFTDFTLSDSAGNYTTVKLGAFTGDVTKAAGSLATTVIALQGNAVSNTAPTTAYPLVWSGSQWAPQILPLAGGGTGTATPSLVEGSGIDITGSWPDQTVSVSATSGGTDYLDHGDNTWEYDSGYTNFRDDFMGGKLAVNGPFGDSGGWQSPAALLSSGVGVNGAISRANGQAPNLGQIILWSDNSANNSCYMFPSNVDTSDVDVGGPQQASWPLLETPGWKMTWVFSVRRPINGTALTSTAFSTAGASIYIGLANIAWAIGTTGFINSGTAATSPTRPPIFFGVRMDTDTGVNVTSTSSGSVGNASAGNTTYTFTTNWTAAQVVQLQVGTSVIITGCSAGSHGNGTFQVATVPTAGSATLVLNNPSGVSASSQTITMTTGDINDGGTWNVEAVMNSCPLTATIYRNNTLGTNGGTNSTSMSITEGTWYRLEIFYPAIGTMEISLFGGGASYSATYTLTQMTIVGNTASSITVGNGMVLSNIWGSGTTPLATTPLVGPGSQVVISGCTSTSAAFNNNGNIIPVAEYATPQDIVLNYSPGISSQAATGSPLMTFWPTVFPLVSASNNASSSSFTAGAWGVAVDFFDFIQNPIFITAVSNTCTAAADASGGATVYSGFTAWTSAQVAALQTGTWVTIAGFGTSADNGTFQVQVPPTSSGTTLTLINANGVLETGQTGTLASPPAQSSSLSRYSY